MAPKLRSKTGLIWFTVATLLRPAIAFSQSFPLDETWPNHQKCVDLSGQESFDPWFESSVTVTLEPQDRAGVVSVVIFELGDEHLGGIVRPGTHEKEVICSQQAAQEGLCNESQLGEFLINDAARAAAKYTMMTRAVNLSKSDPLVYTVRKPGFYCVATFTYSVDRFTGTMVTSEPFSNGPAFKRRLVHVYANSSPVILVVSAIWTSRKAWKGSLAQSKLAISMVILAALESTIRLSQLRESDKTVSAILYAFWALIEVVLASMTIIATSTVARKLGLVWLSLRVVTATTFILAVLWAVWIWVEDSALSTDFRPVFMNLLISSYLSFYFFGCGVAYCRRRQEGKQDMRATVAFGLFVLFQGVLFVTIGAANWRILAQEMDAVDFGKRYWNRRLWLVDAPLEIALPVWTVLTVLLSDVESVRSECTSGSDASEGEMEGLNEEKATEA